MNKRLVAFFWVDDWIFYSKDVDAIEHLILDLKDEFILEKESDMAGFLGSKNWPVGGWKSDFISNRIDRSDTVGNEYDEI